MVKLRRSEVRKIGEEKMIRDFSSLPLFFVSWLHRHILITGRL
jgi:hypothetical protein